MLSYRINTLGDTKNRHISTSYDWNYCLNQPKLPNNIYFRDEDEKSKEKPDAKEKSEADIETKVDTGTDNAETVDKVGSDTKDEEGQNQKSDIDIETQLINQGGVNNEEPNQSSGENRDCKELTAKTEVDKEAEASNMQYTHYEQQETTPTGASGDSEAVCTANTDTKTENEQVRWTVKKIKSEWRRFNLDLSPKVCICFRPK